MIINVVVFYLFYREIVGVVDRIELSQKVAKGKLSIFKFILSNGNLRIKVNVWNNIIAKYEKEIISKRVSDHYYFYIIIHICSALKSILFLDFLPR